MSIITYDEMNGQSLRSHDEMMSMYESWLVKHRKSYNTLGEKNSVANRSYKLGLNLFDDLTNEEYRYIYLGVKTDARKTKSDRYKPKDGNNLPKSIGWRDKGAVAPVKDQGRCGLNFFLK
ncbi:low-temperature-induced cysteine ase-like [Olea europaea subsp. europaea]|uniref:Low-temperature-induced cysteine ase-like n=1 Tax=Olea europaea subsp. europaea TaxID=158383 RepID=A0A8S0PV18_OLEEU|nr:low-temperature-induced cysteine ase-like [Olea europaea subsp. europaea]